MCLVRQLPAFRYPLHVRSHLLLQPTASPNPTLSTHYPVQERLWKQAAAVAIAYEIARMRGKSRGGVAAVV